MKISEVIKGLKYIMSVYGDLDCCYSEDDEGNDYRDVLYEASIMYKDALGVEFFLEDSLNDMKQDCEDDGEEFDETVYKRVCCIN